MFGNIFSLENICKDSWHARSCVNFYKYSENYYYHIIMGEYCKLHVCNLKKYRNTGVEKYIEYTHNLQNVADGLMVLVMRWKFIVLMGSGSCHHSELVSSHLSADTITLSSNIVSSLPPTRGHSQVWAARSVLKMATQFRGNFHK